MPTAPGAFHIVASKIFVRGLRIDAEIGIYPHERGRSQPLDVDVELDVDLTGFIEHIADTINYEGIATTTQSVAAEGHFPLVEGFAERVCEAFLMDPRVSRVRVRVEKPEALAPHAAAAGAEITLVRA